MKRKILTLFLLMFTLVFTLAVEPKRTAEAVAADACIDRCDSYRDNTCWFRAVSAYVNCGQNTDQTDAQCREVRRQAFIDCMADASCSQCLDWGPTYSRTYYCECGKPYFSRDSSGSIIPPYTYEPEGYNETGWYCEAYPEMCNPHLAW